MAAAIFALSAVFVQVIMICSLLPGYFEIYFKHKNCINIFSMIWNINNFVIHDIFCYEAVSSHLSYPQYVMLEGDL